MEEDSMDTNLEHVLEVIRKDVYKTFDRLTTHEERFKLVLKTLIEKFSGFYNFENKDKLTEHSVKLRGEGNRSFSAGLYLEALQEYTESIMYAVNSSEELALAYANRSAALYKLDKYEECLTDIERALNLKYPDRLKTKLYKRKGLCLLGLGRCGADIASQEALIWLDKTNLSKNLQKKCKIELYAMIVAAKSMPVIEPSKKVNELPKLPKPNPKIQSASDAVTVKYSKKYGRHLVANRKIKPGEMIILEEACCKRLHPEFVYKNCSHCLLASYAMIPCDYCVNAAYCSENCRDKAWDEYHEIECSVAGPLLHFHVHNQVCLTLRMAIIATAKGKKLDALRQELITIDRNPDSIAKLYSDDGKIHSDHYRSIHCSEANENDNTSTSELIEDATWVAITVSILAKESEMFGNKLNLDTLSENPDVIFIGGLMCKHLHFGSRIKTQRIGSLNGFELIEYGNSLMAIGSLLNHSCDPNTGKGQSSDLKSHHFAVYPIEKGEQIFDNNGLEFYEGGKFFRMLQFLIWEFNCDCIACIENWPDQLDKILSYKKQALTSANRKKLDKVMQKFKTCNFLLQKGTRNSDPSTLKELIKVIEMLYNLANRPCKELIIATTMLKHSHVNNEAMLDYDGLDDEQTVMQCNRYFLSLKQEMFQ